MKSYLCYACPNIFFEIFTFMVIKNISLVMRLGSKREIRRTKMYENWQRWVSTNYIVCVCIKPQKDENQFLINFCLFKDKAVDLDFIYWIRKRLSEARLEWVKIAFV